MTQQTTRKQRSFRTTSTTRARTKLIDRRPVLRWGPVGGLRPKGPFGNLRNVVSSVAAVQSCFCFVIVAAAIVLGIGALFLLFVLLYSQSVASQSCETLGELLHHPMLCVFWVKISA